MEAMEKRMMEAMEKTVLAQNEDMEKRIMEAMKE